MNTLASALDLSELNQQIEQHYRRGQYRQAIPLVKQVLQQQRQRLGERHPEVAASLNKLALLYAAQGQYRLAAPLYQKTLKLQKSLLGPDHPDVATSLDQFAGLYLRQGKYAQAEPLHDQALKIRQAKFGDKHPATATSFKNVATLYQKQGRYALAEPLYRKALYSLRQTLGPKHPYVAMVVTSLASLHVAQGKLQAAAPLYQQVLKQQKAAAEPNAPAIISTLSRLALLHLHEGRYDLAAPVAAESLAMAQKKLGERHPYVASSRNILAAIYRIQGRFDEAETLFQDSLKLVRELHGEQHPHVAHSLNNLALLYLYKGRYQRAESFAKQALELRQSMLGENHPEVASGQHNLALIYLWMGRYDLAEPLYKQSLSTKRALLGTQHPDVLASLQGLASLYQQQQKYQLAESLHQQALQQAKSVFGAEHPLLGQTLKSVASLYQQQERYDLAVQMLEQGLEIEEQNLKLNLAIGAETQKRQYIAQIRGTTDAVISLHLQDAPKNQAAEKLALKTLLQRKGRILDASSNHVQTLYQNLSPKSQALLTQLTDKRTQLASLYYAPTQLSTAQYRAQLQQLSQAAETLEATLAKQSSRFNQVAQPVTINAVQQQIPANATLIEFTRYIPFNAQASPAEKWGKPRYGVYLLNQDGRIRSLDLGPAAEIDQLAQQFRQALSRRSGDLKRIARKLDIKLMEPVRAQLTKGGAESPHLIISPDGQLNLIPFAALVDEQYRYLVESYEISYLTSGRDLLRFQDSQSSQAPALLVANPTYDKPSDANEVNAEHDETRSHSRSHDLHELAFGPLPGTQAEASAIGPKLPGAIVLTGTKATENALKQTIAPSILHIATHGFFLPDQPSLSFKQPVRGQRNPFRSDILPTATGSASPVAPTVNLENALLRSGLALAGVNPRQSGAEDGVLTALEMSNLRLQGTQLVVLSACETAVGDVANGEGVYGLRRALVLAGAESQVISLWKVDDQGTKDLMVDYYNNLMQKQGRSGALRQVQLAALQSQQYRHPFFWAAFIPSGQWQALQSTESAESAGK
ncbi:CHAT domain-containing tetratricopeptide repeat protein [Romeriopsis navalis]|uniref:CHAT domain-containing tetratricopeptide repeat protein n=1 Tax=Romeriopsis navalis TaxID=2992132 RepID=UPI0021F8A505|nr:CHAT domain-containing tetratricopeptide repeat protein [Romeriopsis navalis]